MSDLSIQTHRWCATNEHWETEVTGSKGDQYTVSYGPAHAGQYQYQYRCTCPHYTYRHQQYPNMECKHIMAVKHDRCAHGQYAVAGSPEEMGETCPKCGGPTAVVSVGV